LDVPFRELERPPATIHPHRPVGPEATVSKTRPREGDFSISGSNRKSEVVFKLLFC
jgi:hypothetical protein